MEATTATREEWTAAREALLKKEKRHMRAGDTLAAERRRMPRLPVEMDYAFEAPDGTKRLVDLFEGRQQLITYHFMWEAYDEPGQRCNGCSMFVDQVGHLAHLNARDTNFVLVSPNVPVDELEDFKRRMGWDVPWYSAPVEFNTDNDVPAKLFGLNVFIRDGEQVFRTYNTRDRGVEALGTVWSLLDVTPLGRQEEWEDSPEGTPQTPPFEWWRRHDEY